MDRPALPVLPPPAHAPGAALHRDDDHGAVLHGDRARLLRYDPAEHPVALQLGGSRSARARAMRAHRRGSRLRRDQSQCRLPLGSRAGRALRRLPDGGAGTGRRLRRRHEGGGARSGHRQMPASASTIRTRRRRSTTLTGAVEAAGVDALIVHARKAWLEGLSPKENREVPPLDYERVFRLKRAHPHLADRAQRRHRRPGAARAAHLAHVDGVMMGRAAYQEPWRLAGGRSAAFRRRRRRFTSAKAAAHALIPYIERELARGTRLHAIMRHVLGLFQAVPGARAFRRMLATAGGQAGRRCARSCARALDLVEPRRACGSRARPA